MPRRRMQTPGSSPKGYAAAIAALRQGLAEPTMEDRALRLYLAVRELLDDDGFLDDPGRTQEVLDTARGFRGATGAGLAHAEETLLRGLADAVLRWCQGLGEDDGLEPFVDLAAVGAVEEDFRLGVGIVAAICAFALETLRAVARPRDPLAGVRRAHAFGILGAAAGLCDVSEALPLAREALRRNRRQEVVGALDFVEQYFAAREGLRLPAAVTAEVRAVAAKTTSRGIAVAALNVLVELGVISEFEALDRIDRWKARHYG